MKVGFYQEYVKFLVKVWAAAGSRFETDACLEVIDVLPTYLPSGCVETGISPSCGTVVFYHKPLFHKNKFRQITCFHQ